jgi:hypothetical protein
MSHLTSVFDVLFNRHEKFSSDAAVGSNPVEHTTVVQAVHQADIARVEAKTAEDAVAAVRVAYSGHTSDIVAVAVPSDPVVEVEPDEHGLSPDEVGPEVVDEPVVDPVVTTDTPVEVPVADLTVEPVPVVESTPEVA